MWYLAVDFVVWRDEYYTTHSYIPYNNHNCKFDDDDDGDGDNDDDDDDDDDDGDGDSDDDDDDDDDHNTFYEIYVHSTC